MSDVDGPPLTQCALAPRRRRSRHAAVLASAAALVFALSSAARAQSGPDFKNKTVTILIGSEPNGGFDTYGRAFALYLGDHLPGHPNVIVSDMPGAGGLIAANYVYNVAPRDGTELAVIGQVAAINQVLDRPGVHYDVRKLAWIGRLTANSQILHTWYKSGITTFADALTHRCVVAGTSAESSSVIFPRLMNDFLGAKFDVVRGYKGPASATLAMERGEVDAVVRPWNDIKAKSAAWLREKKINLIVQFSLKRNPEISYVPAVVDLARTPEERQLFGLFASGGDVGYPVVAPPGLPPQTIAVLRKAFDAAVADPRFLATASKEGLTIDPMSGADLQKLNADALGVSAKIVAEAKKYVAGN